MFGKLKYSLRGRPKFCRCGARLQNIRTKHPVSRRTGLSYRTYVTVICEYAMYPGKHDRYDWVERI